MIANIVAPVFRKTLPENRRLPEFLFVATQRLISQGAIILRDAIFRHGLNLDGQPIAERYAIASRWNVRAFVRDYEASRASVGLIVWGPVGLPILFDGGDVCLEMILGRRAPQRSAWHIDSIVFTF